jgi:hypothetical protein
MAQPGQGRIHPGRRKANPMMTKNGKPRLGPLNLKQLTDLLEKTSVKKVKAKIQRYILRRTKSTNG